MVKLFATLFATSRKKAKYNVNDNKTNAILLSSIVSLKHYQTTICKVFSRNNDTFIVLVICRQSKNKIPKTTFLAPFPNYDGITKKGLDIVFDR